MIAAFASQSPGWHDDLLLIDSTPVECARSRETVKRAGASSLGDTIANAADYGYCASNSATSARTLRGLRARIASRLLALAAAVSLNHQLGRPSRALVDYVA
jgi:hypothetical protein